MRTLPAFVRRTLELEEVVLYEPAGSAPGAQLRRKAGAHVPGDPAASGFPRRELSIGAALLARLRPGRCRASSLDELEGALELTNGESERLEGPAGSFGALALARGDRFFGLLLLRSSAPDFPLLTPTVTPSRSLRSRQRSPAG